MKFVYNKNTRFHNMRKKSKVQADIFFFLKNPTAHKIKSIISFIFLYFKFPRVSTIFRLFEYFKRCLIKWINNSDNTSFASFINVFRKCTLINYRFFIFIYILCKISILDQCLYGNLEDLRLIFIKFLLSFNGAQKMQKYVNNNQYLNIFNVQS